MWNNYGFNILSAYAFHSVGDKVLFGLKLDEC